VFSQALTEESVVPVFVDNDFPQVAISQPVDGASVEGKVNIYGSALDLKYFGNYALDYGQGSAPSVWQNITTSYTAVNNGLLGAWETTGLSGLYTLRLTAINLAGNSASTKILVKIVPVNVPKESAVQQPNLPLTFALPNPFDRSKTSEVTFNYFLDDNFLTKLYLFEVSGNLIWQKVYQAGDNGGKAGKNNPAWNGQDLYGARVANGIYLFQVVATGRPIARGKLIVLN